MFFVVLASSSMEFIGPKYYYPIFETYPNVNVELTASSSIFADIRFPIQQNNTRRLLSGDRKGRRHQELTMYSWSTHEDDSEGWYQINFTENSIQLVGYAITFNDCSRNGHCFPRKNWKFEGLSGEQWVLLDNAQDLTTQGHKRRIEREINDNEYFSVLRFSQTRTKGAFRIYKIELIGRISDFNNLYDREEENY